MTAINKYQSGLISNTLLCEVSRLISGKDNRRYDSQLFNREKNTSKQVFDLLTLIESVILNEKLYTLPSSSNFSQEQLPFRELLIKESIIEELDTKPYHSDLSELIIGFLASVENPVIVAGSASYRDTPISFDRIEKHLRNFLLNEKCEYPDYDYDLMLHQRYSPPKLNDTIEYHHHGFPSVITHLDSFEEMGKALIGWIEYYGSGSYEHCTSVLRDEYYILCSELLKIPYYPQINRLDFSLKYPNYFNKSFKTEIYKKVAKAFATTIDEVYRYSEENTVYIPPFASLVLSQVSKREDIINKTIEIRNDYSKLRKGIYELELEKSNAKTFGKLKSISRRQKEILEKSSKLFDDKSILNFQKTIKYIPDLIKPAMNPVDPTKYSANLLTQPVELIRDWWTTRPVKKIFKISKDINGIKEYNTLLNKIFPEVNENLNWKAFFQTMDNKSSS